MQLQNNAFFKTLFRIYDIYFQNPFVYYDINGKIFPINAFNARTCDFLIFWMRNKHLSYTCPLCKVWKCFHRGFGILTSRKRDIVKPRSLRRRCINWVNHFIVLINSDYLLRVLLVKSFRKSGIGRSGFLMTWKIFIRGIANGDFPDIIDCS